MDVQQNHGYRFKYDHEKAWWSCWEIFARFRWHDGFSVSRLRNVIKVNDVQDGCISDISSYAMKCLPHTVDFTVAADVS